MEWVLLVLFVVLLTAVFFFLVKGSPFKKATSPFSPKWRIILIEKIPYYSSLDDEKKTLFEKKVQEFLLNCKIVAVDTEIDLTDRIMVAASAVIPIMGFSDWAYFNLKEVIVYPGSFDNDFAIHSPGSSIDGMVGTGFMNGKMLLSKKALHQGFQNETDKQNTAIHEFIHLIDKFDGSIDGLPEYLVDKQYVLPWLELIKKKVDEINNNISDIDVYATTNSAEFLAVVGEYFFERPSLLKLNHPDLYEALSRIFKQDLAGKLSPGKYKTVIGRNDPCPCGSGLKYKRCCGKY